MEESSSGSEIQCFLPIPYCLALFFSGLPPDGWKEGMTVVSEDRWIWSAIGLRKVKYFSRLMIFLDNDFEILFFRVVRIIGFYFR